VAAAQSAVSSGPRQRDHAERNLSQAARHQEGGSTAAAKSQALIIPVTTERAVTVSAA